MKTTATCLLEQAIIDGLKNWHRARDRGDGDEAEMIDKATAGLIARLNAILEVRT